MNDRERFYALMARLHTVDANERTDIRRALLDLVGKNQNRPPNGGADGSFTSPQWTAARDLLYAVDALDTAWQRAARVLSAPDLVTLTSADGFLDDDLPF